MFLIYLVSLYLIQLSSAQILSLGQIGNVNSNLQRTVNLPNNNLILANNGMSGLSSVPLNPVPAPTVQIGRNLPVNTVVANGNLGNANFISSNLAGNNLAIPNYGGNLASGVVSANLVNNNLGSNLVANNVGASLVNANLPVNLANGFNINTGMFAATNNGLANLIGRPCGLQIAADALEVGGMVGVNGQLPFYTTVNVNGNLPTSGVGVANCIISQ